MSDKPPVPGCDELRRIVRAMDDTREGFNQRFTAEQLVRIFRAMFASGWDIYPDTWPAWMVKAALRGVVPKFDDNEQPIRQVG